MRTCRESIAALVLATALISFCPDAARAAVVKMTVAELSDLADRIISGDVVDVESYWNDEETLILSSVTVEVQDDLKGNGPLRIFLELFGGTVGDTTMRTSVTPTFVAGDHVLLFLDGQDNRLVGEFQGAYLQDGEEAVQMQPGTARFDAEMIRPLESLLDEIRALLPDEAIPQTLEYDGGFSLSDQRNINFVLIGCDWSYKLDPMDEAFFINANCSDSGCGTDETVIASILRGADVWNNAGADYYFDYAGTTTAQAVSNNSANIIFFDQNSGGGAIATTFFFCSGGNMTGWDITYNDLNSSFWDGVTGSCGGSRYDLQAVGAHELGHGLGLGHSAVTSATMYFSIGLCSTAERTLHSDDIAGIEFIYGAVETELPFLDEFPSITIDGVNWVGIDGAQSNTRGINEPSAPNSLNLDGKADGGDSALTTFMDLSGMSGLELHYFYQHSGQGDPPEVGDDLVIEYSNINGFWVELDRQLGGGPAMQAYENVVVTLPSGAYHNDFRLRFRALSSENGQDDWFVDNICVGSPLDCVVSEACETAGECDDGVDCTVDSCLKNFCVYTADNSACDDEVACTADSCNSLSGCQNQPDDGACSDGNDCTIDSCLVGSGCDSVPDPGASCDDGIDCTVDICNAEGDCVSDDSECVVLEVINNVGPPVCQDTSDDHINAPLAVCNIYAKLLDPTDNLLNTGFAIATTTDPGGFFQHSSSGDTAPACDDFEETPSLECDSFVTIGRECSDNPAGFCADESICIPGGLCSGDFSACDLDGDPCGDGSDCIPLGPCGDGSECIPNPLAGDSTALDPSFNSTAFNFSGVLFGGWFNGNPQGSQGTPDENLRVLIARLAVRQGHSISGIITLFVKLGNEFPIIHFTDLAFECTSDPLDCGDPLCPSDTNADDIVDAADLAELLACWGPVSGVICECLDSDGNGLIDSADLADVLAAWGPCS